MKTHSLIESTVLGAGLTAALLFMIDRGIASAQSHSYNGGMYSENFDSMGGGTTTPASWFIGPEGGLGNTVVVSDGSTAPNASVLGYNFGSTGDPDRALGTIPVGGARNMEVRIQNDTGSDVTSFMVRYDGEQWRIGTMTSATMLVMRYSADGVNYVNMGSSFDFTAPRTAVPPLLVNVPVDGNSPINRASGLGGTYTPAAPVPPGGTIYLRWFDANDTGIDPGLAVDNFSFTVVTGPALSIRQDQSDTVTISWAFPSLGYLLESKPDLSASEWMLVTDGVDVPANDMHNVTVSTSGSARFFRLRNSLSVQ